MCFEVWCPHSTMCTVFAHAVVYHLYYSPHCVIYLKRPTKHQTNKMSRKTYTMLKLHLKSALYTHITSNSSEKWNKLSSSSTKSISQFSPFRQVSVSIKNILISPPCAACTSPQQTELYHIKIYLDTDMPLQTTATTVKYITV